MEYKQYAKIHTHTQYALITKNK